MSRTVVSCLGFILAWTASLPGLMAQSSGPGSSPAATYSALIGKYCLTCHNEKLKTAGLVLSAVDVGDVVGGAPVWEKVIRKLRTRGMPPVGMPRPSEQEYDAFASYLETELDQAAAAHPNPGRPLVHRLNRVEYTNAVRDLLGMEINGEAMLPPDDQGYGFDNIADVLSVSPMLLERYMAVSRKVSQRAVGSPISKPVVETHDVSRFLQQDDRMSEDLPFGSRGGAAVRHFFPLDGEYMIQIRLQRDPGGFKILGLGRSQRLEVRLDDQRLKEFTVGGKLEDSAALRTTEDEYELTADKELELRVTVKAGTRLIGASFAKETIEAEDVIQPRLENRAQDMPAVASVIVTGPYQPTGPGDTASRKKIFICYPSSAAEEDPCAQRILANLARRAYRRPSTERDVEALFRLRL